MENDYAIPLKILLLEDQGLVRAGMRELIQISCPRAEIQEAATFDQAVKQLNITKYDILFLDFDLKSDRTGLDVLKYVREHAIDVRAVMLSGRSEKELVVECINTGASGYILKDMESDGVFQRALDTIFHGGVFLPASVMGRGGYMPFDSLSNVHDSLASTGISGRPLEVLYYLCQGLPNKSIAQRMGVEEGTVRKDYVPKLFRAFKVTRRTELVIEVARRGIRIPDPVRSMH